MDDTDGLAGPGRLQAFSDGVFAIAVTLLVLEVRVPTEPQLRAYDDSLLLALLASLPAVLAYVVSFVTVAVIWLNHHAFFDRVRLVDTTLQWWNLVLLLFVAFTPFPNALIADFLVQDPFGEHARTATALYALVFVFANVPWFFLWRHLIRRPALLADPSFAGTARRDRPRALVGIALYALGALVALVAPIAALLLFLVGAVYFTITANGRRRRGTPG